MTAEIPMKSRYIHNTKQRFAFYSLVRDEYTKSKMDDPHFAKFAADRLGFACTANQVANARRDFKITSNMVRFLGNALGANGKLADRMARVEAWIAMMDPTWAAPVVAD